MDFALNIVVLLLFAAGAFGRSVPNGDSNITEINGINLPEEGAPGCDLNGTFHPLDSTFSAPDDPCLVCECNENWTGKISNSSCYREECDEVDDAKLSDGCIPVYELRKCCIIDYYCRDMIAGQANITEDTEIENDNFNEEREEVICPTPMCADTSCRVETPPGHLCPSCICEGVKENNESEQPSERHPLESQNGTEEFLMPVGESVLSDEGTPLAENDFEANSDLEGDSEGSPQTLQQDGDRNPRETIDEDSSINVIQEESNSKKSKPRRKRSTNTQTSRAVSSHPQQQQQQQQRWTVLGDDQLSQNQQQSSESDERELENTEDYGEMKIFSRGESDNDISDLYEEESVDYEKIFPGCPTPLCENSGCRIGTRAGQQCPTCICNRRHRQP